ASTLTMIAARGWLSSCAKEADNAPTSALRLGWITCARQRATAPGSPRVTQPRLHNPIATLHGAIGGIAAFADHPLASSCHSQATPFALVAPRRRVRSFWLLLRASTRS